MIRILVSILVLTHSITQAQVTNQNLYDTVPNMIEHYHKRLNEFRKQKMEKGKVIFVGNSITEGGESHKLTDNVERINRGIGGDVTFGLLNRLDEITQRAPSKLFVMIGINDISKDFPDAVIANNVTKIVRQIKAESPQTRIYLQSILPVNPQYPRFPQHYDKADHVVSVNKLLKELAISENIYFINLYPLFVDEQQRLNEDLTNDGLHLNEAGYKVWTEFLRENKYL